MLSTIAIALSIGALIYLVNIVVSKANESIEETQEERMARLIEGMKARREAMERAHATVPARRRADLTRV